jgi:hypothetical protein
MERSSPESEKYTEYVCQAIADAQQLVDLLFGTPDVGKITVCGVARNRHGLTATTTFESGQEEEEDANTTEI